MEKKRLPPAPFTILMAEDDPDDQLLTSEAFEEVYLRNPLDKSFPDILSSVLPYHRFHRFRKFRNKLRYNHL